MSSQPNQNPLIHKILSDFQDWQTTRARPFSSGELEQFIKENPLPKMVDIHELKALWDDPKTDHDLGIRTGISETMRVFTGEKLL